MPTLSLWRIVERIYQKERLAKKDQVLVKINVTVQIKADKKSGKRGFTFLAVADTSFLAEIYGVIKGLIPPRGINPFMYLVPRPRIELGTRGFSVRCSTD